MLIRDTNIRIDRDRCIACGICVDRCILDNLRLSVAPCRQSCPLHINCQGFIRLIVQGKEQQAIETLTAFLPFLGVLGLFCHAPCEKACARKKVDRSVEILALHRYLTENKSKFIERASQEISRRPTDKKVAIWGSGPAALMAAWRLFLEGHQIVVFEPGMEPGGAIRDYFSSSQIHEETICALLDAVAVAGVDFITLAEPGKTITYDEILRSYDAAVISYKDEDELLWVAGNKEGNEKKIRLDPDTLQSVEQKQVFLCKEFSSGGLHLVNALAFGKTASESVHRFLSNIPLKWGRGFWQAQGNVKEYTVPFERATHVQADSISAKDSKGKYKNDILRNYTKQEVLTEAERCLSCGRPFDQNNTCWYCLPCEIECPYDAIEVQIPYLLR